MHAELREDSDDEKPGLAGKAYQQRWLRNLLEVQSAAPDLDVEEPKRIETSIYIRNENNYL